MSFLAVLFVYVVIFIKADFVQAAVFPFNLSRDADSHTFSVRFQAVRQSSYDMVSSLIVGGAFVEQVCLTKWTATHEAAKVIVT